MKNRYVYVFRGKLLSKQDPKGLTDCLKYSWNYAPVKIRRKLKKKLFKLANIAAGYRYNENEKAKT
jgi:hypothetical protein